ncbi:ring finger domain protein [Niveomyces insectorum RCEF 264]|uniref:Ring finger domain protein n=1 Tax=Niveomyces insectorum RCEF 264 TaxID=1081102 RepID=A0A162MSZ0_9HYPO|nr:ring finger domain protein [Niveomyces insectorum RCEF 264]
MARMASTTRRLFAAAAVAASCFPAVLVAAQASPSSEAAQIFPVDSVQNWQAEAAMTLQVSVPTADIQPLQFTVVPLTNLLGLNLSEVSRGSVDIEGQLIAATASNYVNISGPNDIAYLSCDSLNSSFIDANRMFDTLMNNLPAAILLYSQSGNCCNLNATNLAYQTIFTMVDAGEASATLNLTNSGDGLIAAAISGNATTPDSGGQDSQSGSNSAIAMSILYSITGLITLLFLVIIGTGALRAHRYPERYGPRSAYGGRPRQSRAKGIARAVLETLPIVKFGDPTPVKPDPNYELESVPDGRQNVAGAAGLSQGPTDVQVHHLSTIPEDAETQARLEDEATMSNAVAKPATEALATGVADALPNQSSASREENEHLGCSICTEDFTVGEDVRVLPCNHKFHPNCVDPWLVNVSGTCPLCRLDLRPDRGATDGAGASDSSQAHMPPPLDADEAGLASAESYGAAGHRRRSSRLFDLNRLRHASVEERIEALRRYRVENQAESQAEAHDATSAHGSEDEQNRSAKLTKRLRDKFRIRTRAQSPESSRRSRSG